MMRVEKSIRAIERVSNHSATPICPVTALCLMMDTSREREIIVAPRRKLVIIVNLKLAASRSNFDCSINCVIRAQGGYKRCETNSISTDPTRTLFHD